MRHSSRRAKRMTGEPENDRCYFCGGKVKLGLATLPLVFGSRVVIVKQVPAEVCGQCGEPMIASEAATAVDGLLKQAQRSGFELSLLTYKPLAAIAA
jgi:YgiT-type zinc finger domain-containing protein